MFVYVPGDVMMIEGDILFKGYNTDTQQLVPVMAHPPQIDSDITLMEWLDMAAGTGKGIKLDFKSIECVELSLQILHEKQSKVFSHTSDFPPYWEQLIFMIFNFAQYI